MPYNHSQNIQPNLVLSLYPMIYLLEFKASLAKREKLTSYGCEMNNGVTVISIAVIQIIGTNLTGVVQSLQTLKTCSPLCSLG